MLNNLIIAAIPHTEPWGLNTAMVMISSNLVAIAIGRLAISSGSSWRAANPETNSSNPLETGLLSKSHLSELIASMSFGHILGVGAVLGLTNVGVI